MIQELIHTSMPKGLAPDKSGYCTASCSQGMNPLLERALENLSGYRWAATEGEDRRFNPVSYLSVLRQIGGVEYRILSRVADCGSDYTGRTNKIAHHLALENRSLPVAGPAAILMHPGIFCENWVGPARYVSRNLSFNLPPVNPLKCVQWERACGDAGWGGIVAQAVEEGRPVSLIFTPGMELLPLIAESLALLPPEKRWKTSFSTFFMKSQELQETSQKIQIKCILAGSPEMGYARLSAQTLYIDLRSEQTAISESRSKYVETARTGVVTSYTATTTITPSKTGVAVPQQSKGGAMPTVKEGDVYKLKNDSPVGGFKLSKVAIPQKDFVTSKPQPSAWQWVAVVALILLCIGVPTGIAVHFWHSARVEKRENEKAEMIRQVAEKEKQATADAEAARQAEADAEAARQAEADAEVARQAEADAEAARQAAVAAEAARQAAVAAEAARQKVAEDEKQKIAEAFDAITGQWKNETDELRDGVVEFGESLSGVNASTLVGTENLWEFRDNLKVQYTPFLSLEAIVDVNTLVAGSLKVEEIEPTDKNGYLFYQFDINTDGKNKQLATLKLTESGLVFEWNEKLSTMDVPKEIANRILWSKLKLTCAGNEQNESGKEFPLKFCLVFNKPFPPCIFDTKGIEANKLQIDFLSPQNDSPQKVTIVNTKNPQLQCECTFDPTNGLLTWKPSINGTALTSIDSIVV